MTFKTEMDKDTRRAGIILIMGSALMLAFSSGALVNGWARGSLVAVSFWSMVFVTMIATLVAGIGYLDKLGERNKR